MSDLVNILARRILCVQVTRIETYRTGRVSSSAPWLVLFPKILYFFTLFYKCAWKVIGKVYFCSSKLT
jgi:hypothetical protein